MKTKFKSNTEYLAMTAQWAKSSKSIKCKSILEPCDEYKLDENGREYFSEGTGVNRRSGWMAATHHVLYNILRDKDPSCGFTSSVKPNKQLSKPDAAITSLISLCRLQEQMIRLSRFKPNGYLTSIRKGATTMVDNDPMHGWAMRNLMIRIDYMLAPFGDTVTIEQIMKLEIPEQKSTHFQHQVMPQEYAAA